MYKAKATIANTLVNKRGEAITREALEGMVAQIKEHYLPINIEHDPRIPVQGRIADAYLQEMDCGGFEVVAELEIFDENDTSLSVKTGKTMIQRRVPKDKAIIHYDRNFENPEDEKNINNILESIKGHGARSVKNSLDPIAVLEIVALVGFGSIAKGFLSKVGGDSWEYVRDNIKSIFSRKKEGEKEKILSLSFRVVRNEIEFDVEVVATNPSMEEIDQLFSDGLRELDEIVLALYSEEVSLNKMVFEFKKEGMEIKYAVTQDCFPLLPRVKVIDEESPRILE